MQLDPAVLLVAPLSGHYATLLRGTVESLIPHHAVFVTDWSNARDVPMAEGRFDLDDYIDHIRTMLGVLGARAHVIGVCQPGPAVLAASALMAEDKDPGRPRSMTFMGSPIDARFSPTVTNRLAEERPFTWFQSNMIYTVPPPHPGVLRRVYPGFVQLASFMSMNMQKHQDAHKRYFEHLVAGDGDSAEKHRVFYDEYLSVLDLTEEFYLQTVEKVFQKHLLPQGKLYHRDRPDDRGRRAGRYLRGRTDPGRPWPLPQHPGRHEGTLHPAGCRPLRRFQRQALQGRDLSPGRGLHPPHRSRLQQLTATDPGVSWQGLCLNPGDPMIAPPRV
jgi:poly(3-hydroxybutyrate) depolymerase